MTWPMWTLASVPWAFQRYPACLSGAYQLRCRTAWCKGWSPLRLKTICHSFSPCTYWHKYEQPSGPQRRAAYTPLTLWLQSGRGAVVFVIPRNFILCLMHLIVLCLIGYQILLIIKVLKSN